MQLTCSCITVTPISDTQAWMQADDLADTLSQNLCICAEITLMAGEVNSARDMQPSCSLGIYWSVQPSQDHTRAHAHTHCGKGNLVLLYMRRDDRGRRRGGHLVRMCWIQRSHSWDRMFQCSSGLIKADAHTHCG